MDREQIRSSECCVYATFVVADDQLLWHAIVLLEKAISRSRSNFQFKLLLIQLYSTLGRYTLSYFSNFLHSVYYIYDWWRFGSVGNIVGRVNEVNQSRARLVLGWVTVCRQVNHLCM